MPDSMLQWIVGQAGTGAIAALALVMLREAYRVQAADRDTLIKTLQGVTQAMTMLTSVVERVANTVGNCEAAQDAARERRDIPASTPNRAATLPR